MKVPIYTTELTGAGMWSQVIGRGKILTLTDLQGGANVGMMLYHANERTERYNMSDTLKGQQVFFLEQGLCLHSDMGRLLASIIDDTCGWHDAVCGTSDAAEVLEKYGALSYQDGRNDWHRNGKDCFLIELAKWGLGEKDWMPNVNFFSKVVPNEAGDLRYVEGNSAAGSKVSLRMEMDVLVVINTCQHPLAPAGEYRQNAVLLEVFAGDPVTPDDACLISHPENGRAYENTMNYYKLRM